MLGKEVEEMEKKKRNLGKEEEEGEWGEIERWKMVNDFEWNEDIRFYEEKLVNSMGWGNRKKIF